MQYSVVLIFFVWLCYFGDLAVMCYKIPQAQLEILQTGFRVSIPHESGIASVIYNIEVNQQCPVIYDLITEQRGNLWISEQTARKLYANDEVRINVVVQQNDNLFTRTDIARISKNLQITYENVKSGDQPVDVCNFDDWKGEPTKASITTYRLYRPSPSTVYFKKQLSQRVYNPNELIFEDNFQKLDTTIWSYDIFMYSNAIGDKSEEFTMFTNDKDNLSVKGGELLITPSLSQRQSSGIYNVTECKGAICYENRVEPCAYKKDRKRHYMYPAPVDSAKISTRDSFSFTYGRIEINAKLPEGDWLFPYIMLQPDKLNCSMRKQLRIAYATSKDLENSRIRGGPVILHSEIKLNNKPVFERTSHMTFHTVVPNKYHNFTMIWTSEQIALFVDGDKYGCIANNGQYTESYHIVLGVSAGGHLEYTETNSKPWNNGHNNAAQAFHESFTGCCARNMAGGVCTQEVSRAPCSKSQTPKMDCKPAEKSYVKKRCSKPWGPQSTMAVKYVRVYAV